ncbi:MAG: sulfotransferase [Nitriliruptorales bacterium]
MELADPVAQSFGSSTGESPGAPAYRRATGGLREHRRDGLTRRASGRTVGSEPSPSQPAPHFVIVGTPRSGTTLVQRLACELPGVVMPPETHFFSLFVPELVRRRRLPLGRVALREELRRYGALETSRELDLDVDVVLDTLGGRCDSLVDLFGALVRHLAGEGEIYGEKTPTHLRWWRPLTEAHPDLKVVAVVRDPRAVIASNLAMPWGMKHHVTLAEMWRQDQRLIRQARTELGHDRCLVLRYEDVVAAPDSAREALKGLLMSRHGERPEGTATLRASSSFVQSWEWWKQGTQGQVTTERVEAWRNQLSPRQATAIAAICRREMQAFGYSESVPGPIATVLRLARLGPSGQGRRYRLRRSRRRQLEWIDGLFRAPRG